MTKKNVFKNYKILRVGSRTREGDQSYDPHTRGWFNIVPGYNASDALKVIEYVRVRRPKPQPKYYYLKAGELIQKGDEWEWAFLEAPWSVSFWEIGQKLWLENEGKCRRLIKKGK